MTLPQKYPLYKVRSAVYKVRSAVELCLSFLIWGWRLGLGLNWGLGVGFKPGSKLASPPAHYGFRWPEGAGAGAKKKRDKRRDLRRGSGMVSLPSGAQRLPNTSPPRPFLTISWGEGGWSSLRRSKKGCMAGKRLLAGPFPPYRHLVKWRSMGSQG